MFTERLIEKRCHYFFLERKDAIIFDERQPTVPTCSLNDWKKKDNTCTSTTTTNTSSTMINATNTTATMIMNATSNNTSNHTNSSEYVEPDDYFVMKPWDVSNLSDTQEIVLSILGIPTSLLSIFCSLLLVRVIWKKQRGSAFGGGYGETSMTRRCFCHCKQFFKKLLLDSPYNRILFLFSIYDIIASINYIFSPFLLNSSTSFRPTAFGNKATCNVSGAIFMFGLSSFYYYWLLSVYFFLTIRFGIKQATFAKWWEPPLHLLCAGVPLIDVIIGFNKDVYSETELAPRCMWGGRHEVCTDPVDIEFAIVEHGMPKCVKNVKQHFPVVRNKWNFNIFMGAFAILFIIVSNIIITWYVRSTIYNNHKRKRRSSTNQSGRGCCKIKKMLTSASTMFMSDRNTCTTTDFTTVNKKSNIINNNNSNNNLVLVSSSTPSKMQIQRIQQVAVQSLLFVSACVFTMGSVILLGFLDSFNIMRTEELSDWFWLLVYQQVALPSVGILNFAIYLRPTYLRIRRQFPHQTKMWTVKRSLFGDEIKPTQIRKEHREEEKQEGGWRTCWRRNNQTADHQQRLPVLQQQEQQIDDHNNQSNNNNNNNGRGGFLSKYLSKLLQKGQSRKEPQTTLHNKINDTASKDNKDDANGPIAVEEGKAAEAAAVESEIIVFTSKNGDDSNKTLEPPLFRHTTSGHSSSSSKNASKSLTTTTTPATSAAPVSPEENINIIHNRRRKNTRSGASVIDVPPELDFCMYDSDEDDEDDDDYDGYDFHNHVTHDNQTVLFDAMGSGRTTTSTIEA